MLLNNRIRRMAAIMICLLVALPLLGVTSALSLRPGVNTLGHTPSEEPPVWTSRDLGEDIHVVEISEAGYTRPFYSAAGSRNKLHLFSADSNNPLWSDTDNFKLGGLMFDDSTYGEKVEWNSVDISVEPVRVVAGLRNSTVRLYDENGLIDEWRQPKRCGSGEVRAVEITPGADLIIAVSDYGPLENVAQNDWRMFHRDTKHTGLSPFDTSKNAGLLRWDLAVGGYVRHSPVIGSDGTVYIGASNIGTSSGWLYAIDLYGDKIWEYAAGDEVSSTAAIGSDGTVYFGSTDHKLYAIDPDGDKLWDYPTGGLVGSPTIGPDDVIYFQSTNDKLYALDSDGNKLWDYYVGDEANSPAVGTDGTIYANGGDNARLTALDSDGNYKWHYTAGGWLLSSPAIGTDGSNDVIYFGSDDTKLYAVDSDGDKLWDYDTGGHVRTSPAIGSDGSLYFGSYDNKFYALDADGNKLWDYNTGGDIRSSAAIGSDGRIYVGSDDGKLYAFDSNGNKKWHYETGSQVWSSPAIDSEGRISVGSFWNNKVHTLSPRRPYLCAFAPNGDVLFEDYIYGEYGYWPTDVDISESGKFITVSMAGDSAITVMYDYGDRQAIYKNEVIFEVPNPSKKVMPGDMVAYEFSIYNEIGITQLVRLTRDEPPEGWFAKFILDGMVSWDDTVGVSLSPGESVDGNFWVWAPPSAQPPEIAEIWVHAEAKGDPNFPPGIVDVLTTTTVSLTPAPPVPPTAHIDDVTPPTPVVGELVQFSGHAVAASGIGQYKWISSLDGVLNEGPTYSAFSTTNLSAGFHTIYFQVQDNEGVWSKFDISWVVVRSGLAIPLGEKFTYENTDLTASIAEISKDGRVVAIGSLYWHTVGTEKTSLCTYYTVTNDWSSSDYWTHDFTDELEVTTISLSELGSFIFVGTYTTSPAEAEVYVFLKETGSVIEDWTLDDLRIWSSDYDLYPGFTGSGFETGRLVLGASGESTHTVYYYWWTAHQQGDPYSTPIWYSSVGVDVAAVDISITDDNIEYHGSYFAGDRWDATSHVYHWRVLYLWV